MSVLLAALLVASLAALPEAGYPNPPTLSPVVPGETASGGKTNGGEPGHRLFNTLLVTFAAIGLGRLCVRFRLVEPEKGHTQALGVFTGKIAFPFLIFNTVATADLASVDPGTIMACTLGKLVVMVLTGMLTFSAYESKRPTGRRVLTGTVFAFFSVASNDFAIGFPVIEAISGEGMAVYVAANALVGSMLFVPLAMIILALGEWLLSREEQSGDGDEESGGESRARAGRPRALSLLLDILSNPVITCTIIGLLYRGVLGRTLRLEGGKLKLPPPLSDAVELVTSPFVMCSLFLTGTTLKSAKLELWPAALVLMKVIVCAFVSYFFGEWLVSSNCTADMRRKLVNFTFFYGTIPASSAPLVFANQFDPSTSGIVSTAILLGMILAGPIMFVTALFLQDTGTLRGTLDLVQLSMSATSLALGAVCGVAVAILALNFPLGFRYPCKMLLGVYGLMALVYEAVIFLIHPDILSGPCMEYADNPWSVTGLLTAWLQNNCRCFVLLLQAISVFAPRELKPDLRKGTAMVAMCFIAALVPAFTSGPNTLDQICELGHRLQEMRKRLAAMLVWSTVMLLASAGLGVVGIYRMLSEVGIQADSEASEGKATNEVGSEASEGKATKELSSRWITQVPRSSITTITILSALNLLTQVVNTSTVVANPMARGGSFDVMLILEIILQHGRVTFLALALFFNNDLALHILGSTPKRWFFLAGKARVKSQSHLEINVLHAARQQPSLQHAITTPAVFGDEERTGALTVDVTMRSTVSSPGAAV